MIPKITALIVVALFAYITPSEARQHYRHYSHHIARTAPEIAYRASGEGIIGGRPSGCPHAYCGCSASLRAFGRIIPELNLAANWRRFPAALAAPGMAAWRWGHVFIIEAVNGDGTVVAHDGNSGRGLTRIHAVSLRNYHVVNPHGGRFASKEL